MNASKQIYGDFSLDRGVFYDVSRKKFLFLFWETIINNVFSLDLPNDTHP